MTHKAIYMKRIILGSSLLFCALFAVPAMHAQESVQVLIRDTGTERQESIELPKSMTYPLDSLLNDWKAKNYIDLGKDCSTSTVNPMFSDSVYIDRLSRMPTVMEMPYNEIVRKFIDMYTGRLRNQVAFMLSACNFYMPIFEEALDAYGADAIRWYFYVNSAPWLPNRFHGKAVVEGQRKFMGTLWNTYAFFVLYANIDDFDATKYTLDYDKLSVMDKWLLSKLNSAIKAVDYDLSNYKIPEAAKALQSFVDDMSNWYVRRSRERFWAKGMEQDKINAYMTLYTALVEICKTAAPMIPFMTEEIYQNLVRSVDESAPESIHLCDFPVVNEAHIDTELEANMDNVLKLVVMGRACRNTANIKNRQPIGQMYVKADFEIPEFYKDIVKDELNVKNVTFTQDVRDFTSYTFKPQLKTVGPKYGKMLGGIKAALENLEGNAAMDELNATDALKLDINGQEVTLFREDLLIESAQMPGYVSENDNGITVVMDTNLSEELLEEGFVREIISKVQTMRKEAGFEVMDKIAVTYEGTEKAEKVFADNASTIADETLALEVTKAAPAGYTKEWKINGEAVTIGVEKR